MIVLCGKHLSGEKFGSSGTPVNFDNVGVQPFSLKTLIAQGAQSHFEERDSIFSSAQHRRKGPRSPSRPCHCDGAKSWSGPPVPAALVSCQRGASQRPWRSAHGSSSPAARTSTTPRGLSPRSTKTAYDAWQILVHVASKNTAHLEFASRRDCKAQCHDSRKVGWCW